jgi:hypothetical protein
MINKQQQSSTLVMTLAIIAATMLVSTVIVETLDLFDDAEALRKKAKKRKADFTLPELPILVPISLPSPSILNQLV